MRAEYDSRADAISIRLLEVEQLDRGDEVHPQAIVGLVGDRAAEVQLLYPGDGLDEPLAAAADRYQLDLQLLKAAASSALAVPDRVVTVEVRAPSGTQPAP